MKLDTNVKHHQVMCRAIFGLMEVCPCVIFVMEFMSAE